jgi:NAD(P)-dependent dehydrogenase (short-subunit alcohol dehydrogenase family)
MLLENKVAVIYGAGGSIGGAVARGFAREGANVFLAGRTQSSLDKVAEEIRSKGGTVQVAEVDALDAMEGLRRQWAVELGQYGIRVLTLKTGGIPESIPEDAPERDEIIDNLLPQTLLHRAATLEDVGNVAAFAASDRARTITSAEINISCGAIVD